MRSSAHNTINRWLCVFRHIQARPEDPEVEGEHRPHRHRPNRIYAIDAKRYSGEVKRRNVGTIFRPVERLYVGSRNCTELASGALRQMAVVRSVLPPEAAGVPIYGALCFVDAQWSLFRDPFHVDGVWVGWPKALQKMVARPGPFEAATVDRGARDIAAVLSSA